MPWTETIQITDCAHPSTNLAYASIYDGYQTFSADVNGQFIAFIDDAYSSYTVSISKPNYSPRNFAFTTQKAGTVQPVCLNAVPPSTGGGGTPPRGCFIVSATTGSVHSAENMRLNMLRQRVVASTDLGEALLDAIYRDYYSFSPPIAAELREGAELREQVLRTCVRPLLAWFGLVEAVALDGADRRRARRAVLAVLDACESPSAEAAARNARLAEALCRGTLSRGAPQPFAYLAARLGDAVALPFSRWAIFDPLVRVWRCAAGDADVLEQLDGWLTGAPFDRLPAPARGERLDAELELLAAGPYASDSARAALGGRLAIAWPELSEELRRHGFVT